MPLRPLGQHRNGTLWSRLAWDLGDPQSWKEKAEGQSVAYPDGDALQRVLGEMANLPPLVTSWEVEALKDKLASAARGDAFLLQGGDCAEQFEGCTSDAIAVKLKILLQMSVVLIHGTRKPVIRVGRIAGQYAKPRSSAQESRGDVDATVVPRRPRQSARVHDRGPHPRSEPAPAGLRARRVDAELHPRARRGRLREPAPPEYWNVGFANKSSRGAEYQQMVGQVQDSISFMQAVTGGEFSRLERVDFYTSHEALALNYEAAQTRQVPRREGWYNLTTHLPWMGCEPPNPTGRTSSTAAGSAIRSA